jgi:hypothetical protein
MSLHCGLQGGAKTVATTDVFDREGESKGSGATLGDHLAAQGTEPNGLYVRGARIKKREVASEPPAAASTEFLAVRIESPTEVAAPSRAASCCIRHSGGHVLEFAELPNPTWLATLWSEIK